MFSDPALLAPMLTGLLGLVAATGLLLALVWWIGRRNRSLPEHPRLWDGRDYACPDCGAPMVQGWVLLGKGAIWSDRAKGRPGAFSPITASLPNTLSLRLRPAANMAWRCPACRLLLIDHSKLVH